MEREIKIGGKRFDKLDLIKAVEKATKITEVADNLGIDKRCQPSLQKLAAKIIELGIPVDHIQNFEKALQNRPIKQFIMSLDNRVYFEAFVSKYEGDSKLQYNNNCGNLLQSLGEQDFATITVEQFEQYFADKQSSKAYNRSMLMFVTKNNINGAAEKINRDMLIYLIPTI